MLRNRFIIAYSCVLFATLANAQTSNPFDLKWKSGNVEPGEIADTSPAPADALSNTPEIFPAPTADAAAEDITPDVVTRADNSVPAEVDSQQEPNGRPPPVSDRTAQPAVEEEQPTSFPETDDRALGDDDREDELSPILPGPTRNVGVLLIITMLGLSVLVLTWAVNANRGFLRKIYRAAMNANLSALLLREQKFASLQYLYYIVYATFFINASLFLFLISRYSGWNFGNGRTPLLLFLGVLVAIYLSRHLFMRILGSTFMIETETTHYNFNILLYNILVGIALIPVNLFLAFGPETARIPVIYAGLGLIGLLYLLRQLRGINIASHLISGHIFQFFVYLCAVEILPVLVLFKYFITD